MRLSRRFIENLLLIGRAGPRFLHQSAVQIDVWAAFGENPDDPVDLLLTPIDHLPAAKLAARLVDFIYGKDALEGYRPVTPPRIFPLEGFVAIHAERDLLLRVLLPLTELNLPDACEQLQALVEAWLHDPSQQGGRSRAAGDDRLSLQALLEFAAAHRTSLAPDLRLTVLYLLMVADDPPFVTRLMKASKAWTPVLDLAFPETLEELVKKLPKAPIPIKRPAAIECDGDRLIWQVARNRPVQMMGSSIETVKADAARRLFQTSARHLAWAVIDSGIDGAHPAFRDHDAGGFATRIVKAYDFSKLRDIAAYDTLLHADFAKTLNRRLKAAGLNTTSGKAWLERLREDARKARPFDWSVLGEVLETPVGKVEALGPDGKPVGHGTHVAGVLAGDWRENDKPVYQGVCPDLKLYDLRILGKTNEDTEFAVIAALEFVRWLNARNRYPTIHGVNMSLGLVHDVRNFACGQTPVCKASDATVRSGVVVVAAAGNWGYQDFTTASGGYKGYATVSIADPGNTESVITVGATHRDRPHEYGVSFFSSRGPTGDGRSKPDLVAPGEKIEGPLPDLGIGNLDGTSMAAPHVSGVAALLMARHAELVGQPLSVKRVLIDTATDLGRERHFQGAGLVDALRALQSQ